MTIKSTERKQGAGYVLTLHRCMDCSANCHKIDINPTLLQGVAKKDSRAVHAAM